MKRFVHTMALALVVFTAQAQYGESIRSGRPGQAIGPFTVGKGIFQQQSGVDWNSYTGDGVDYQFTSYVLNNVFRYGIGERTELGMGVDFQSASEELIGTEFTSSGISAFSIRARRNLLVGEGFKPSIGLQANLGLPYLSDDFKRDYIAPKLILVTGQNITDKLGLTTNSGVAWNGFNDTRTYFYVLNLSYSITSKFGVFAENYGTIVSGNFDTKFDGGFDYFINNDLKLDLTAGYDKNEFVNEFFVSLGVSWRTKRK